MAAVRIVDAVLREVWRETVPQDGGTSQTVVTGILGDPSSLSQVQAFLTMNSVAGYPVATATPGISGGGFIQFVVSNTAPAGNTFTFTLDVKLNHSVGLVPNPVETAPVMIMGSPSQNLSQINPQSGTNYSLVLNDVNKVVILSNVNPIAVKLDTHANVPFEIGACIDLVQGLAGKVTVVPEPGVTLNSKGGNRSISSQWVAVSLIQTAADVWLLVGDLIA